MGTEILEEVFSVVQDRKENPREDSYVSSLYSDGRERILGKLREESHELMKAVDEQGESEIIHESADVIFHILVLLSYEDVDLEQVMDELRDRRKPRESE